MEQRHASDDWTFTTPAFQQEAMRLFIDEANAIARDLNLPEKLPITKNDLVELRIGPPRIFRVGLAGTLATSNYLYIIRGRKMGEVTRADNLQFYEKVRKEFYWLSSRVDTNAAVNLATEFLTSAKIDVAALNRDCVVKVKYMLGDTPWRFVPSYWVNWQFRTNQLSNLPAATVELVLPTRTMRSLSVFSPQYILRKPLLITNLTELLSQTNAP